MNRDSKGKFTSGERKINQFGYTLYFTETEKECRKCNKIKTHLDFHKDSTNKYGLSYWCKECANASSRKHHARRMRDDPEYQAYSKNRHKKIVWGLSGEEYEALWKEQKTCAICEVELTGGYQTHRDHCHKTGKIREFLCTNCNRGLGHFKDNPETLGKAIKYLSKHNNNEDVIKEGS